MALARIVRILCLLLATFLATFFATPPSASGEESLACNELTVFVRQGCPHCDRAKDFLASLQDRHPGLAIRVLDVGQSPEARAAFEAVNRERRVRQPGVPTFSFCGEVQVGFDTADATGRSIEQVLTGELDNLGSDVIVQLPLLGRVSPTELGLPLFTIAIGLVDGFNPCAMWVLLFLLSLLVHVRDRGRILLVAGTFVLVSGAIYFAFMAAWLNLYLVLGFSRTLQLILGVFALLIGLVHIKDFFAFRAGFSLSIPEGIKPTLYQRARQVVRAENLFAAILGVTTIAILVNTVELLCTAGLPALYTQVLTYYSLGTVDYYGYLLLYNLAYIFDDAIMVGIAVITLGQYKLQERGGRWLKLLSGGIILALGLLLILAPGWLVI